MKKAIGIFVVIGLIAVGLMATNLVEQVEANEVCVIQDPIDGDLHVYTSPGMQWQNLGTVTKYHKSTQFWFSDDANEGGTADGSARTRFNDGASTKISGSVRWDFPLADAQVLSLHKKYGSMAAIEKALIKTVMDKSVYMSGPLMSSKESYSDKRNDLILNILDQAKNGVYKTISKEEKEADPISGEMKTVKKVYILEENGIVQRQEPSPLIQYGIILNNFSIQKIVYSSTVEDQIKLQQTATMAIQTAMAEAKEAEQRAIKAEADGKARATQAQWDQEVIKAKLVTEAEQKRDVAELAMKEAEFFKKQQILKGEGEAARKRLVMVADGALDKKLKAYVEVNKNYATAIGAYKGNWVPTIEMGSGSKSSGSANGASDLINLLNAKTAIDLSLNMKVKK